MPTIRPEAPRDHEAVYQLNVREFETPAEARLVNCLRNKASPLVSLVTESSQGVIGHILFSPVQLAGAEPLLLMGLAPMAVDKAHRRRGIGTALVKAGLDACRELDTAAVVVLGHPQYYPRFGFRPAAEFALQCEYAVNPDAFMVQELKSGCLTGLAGTVLYHSCFAEL